MIVYCKMLPSLARLDGPLNKGPRLNDQRPSSDLPHLSDLPQEIQTLILKTSIPFNVFERVVDALCLVDKKFAALCRDNKMWSALLEYMKWDRPWTKDLDPKSVFKMLRSILDGRRRVLNSPNIYTVLTDNAVHLDHIEDLAGSLCRAHARDDPSEDEINCNNNDIWRWLLTYLKWDKPCVAGLDPKTTFNMLREIPRHQLAILLAWDVDTTQIVDMAFMAATGLQLTTLPSNVTHIAYMAFRHCRALALTTLPPKTTHIGDYAFESCISLKLTTLPPTLTYIGVEAFSGCHNLALTALPHTLDSIGDRAFQHCVNLPAAVQNAIRAINPKAM